jgi:hypothetical protein
MQKQLNVRSDDAYARARRLARRLNTSTTKVVEAALARYDRETATVPTYNDLSPEQKAFADQLLAMGKASRNEGDPNATSDHSWLYDEFGLPR